MGFLTGMVGGHSKKWRTLAAVALLLSVCVLLSPECRIQSVAPLDAQTYSVYTDCDACVKSTQPNSALGMEEVLEISLNRTALTSAESVVFIKQDLSGLQPDDIVLSAWLIISWKFVVTPANHDLLVGAYWCSDSAWREESITWNSAPWSAVANTSLDSDNGTPLSQQHEFDVTTAVQNSLASKQVTIALRAEENGTAYFWSHHGLPGPGMQAHLFLFYVSAEATNSIQTNIEYMSGFLPDLSLWYSWINTGYSHLIFIVAAYPQYSYYFPSVNFVGQHFYGRDGTELMVGHALLLYELYNDTNQNGYLDADFANGTFETSYYLALNMSTGFIPQPVQKTPIGGLWHYLWGVRYTNVMGFLIPANGSAGAIGDTAALLTLDYLETKFDYYLQANATYLKTSLSFGSVTHFDPMVPGVVLDELSLAALYSTILLTSSGGARILVESAEYNSSLAAQPTLPMAAANIASPTSSFYNFLFNDSYTLYSQPPTSYPAQTSACPSTSLHPHVAKKQFELPLGIFQGFLLAFLPRIANASMKVDFDYQQSGLLYRVNYPVWNGNALVHDPTYVAYLSGLPLFPPPLPPIPLWVIVPSASVIIGTLVLLIVLLRRRRSKKRLGESQVESY